MLTDGSYGGDAPSAAPRFARCKSYFASVIHAVIRSRLLPTSNIEDFQWEWP
jgi:hypothetical protein